VFGAAYFAVWRTRLYALRERRYRRVPLGWSTGEMDVLVIGGSVFLGRALVAEALMAGATVTVFNRGKSGSTPAGATQITGDRTNPDDLAQLAGRSWDLVVDTCGYVPAEVALSANLLAPQAGHYAFVSSINAYPGWPEAPDYRVRGEHDGSPDATRGDVPDGISESETYGWLKVGCERAVSRAFGIERCTILRGGCIVGPDDGAVGRLPWWIDRVARGREVLVPGSPSAPVALIDSRDLARFALRGVPGVFETPGPLARDTRADLMAACAAATGSDATFTYVDDEEWLVGQGVEEWTELPLWAPQSTAPSLFTHHPEQAEAAGLRWRPLAETVADTWTWQRSLPEGWRPSPRTPGLAPEREQDLLAAWHSSH
jgi:2'-hydroxyisoflavone reductase